MKFLRQAVGRRQEPAGRDAAADGRPQVPAPRHRRAPTTWPAGSRRRATSSSPTAGIVARQHRGRARSPPDQLRMIADFVSLRGGGLLALGGRRAFAEGGYAGTPVAESLPVAARGRQGARDTFLEDAQGDADAARPDARRHADRRHRAGVGGALGVAAAADDGQPDPAREAGRGGAARPGATAPRPARRSCSPTSATAPARPSPFPVQDSWMWQMHADIPARGPDARDVLAAAAALARGRRARARRRVASTTSASSAATPCTVTAARPRRPVHRRERRGRAARRSPGPTGERRDDAAALRRRPRRRIPRDVRGGRRTGSTTLPSTATRGERAPCRQPRTRVRARGARRSASTSTPRCGRPSCSASPRTPAAASTRRRPPRRCPRTSPTSAAA